MRRFDRIISLAAVVIAIGSCHTAWADTVDRSSAQALRGIRELSVSSEESFTPHSALGVYKAAGVTYDDVVKLMWTTLRSAGLPVRNPESRVSRPSATLVITVDIDIASDESVAVYHVAASVEEPVTSRLRPNGTIQNAVVWSSLPDIGKCKIDHPDAIRKAVAAQIESFLTQFQLANGGLSKHKANGAK